MNISKRIQTGIVLLFAAACLAYPPFARAGDRHTASFQAGWLHVEGEFRTDIGLYANVGTLWPFLLMNFTLGPTLPLEWKVGYQLDLTESWSLRLGQRFSYMLTPPWSYSSLASSPHPANSGDNAQMIWTMTELGCRYEAQSGFVFGIDFPFYVIRIWLDDDYEPSDDLEVFTPPESLLAVFVYLGCKWDF